MKYTIKFVNESWGNFNTKIAKITSKIIKTWANYWREKFPRIAHKSDRLVLIDVLWSYNKLKRHLETEITVDGINYYFVLDIKNKLNGISYQNGNNIIINIPFEKNNDKFYKMLKDDEYWKRLQDTINHELTHYFDKENDMMQNYYDSHSQGSYLHWVLYNTQEIEMRAFIQQFMPHVKKGKSFIECLDDRLKKAFKKDYTKLKTTFVKFVKYSYLSYIKHDVNMRNKYWKYIINDPEFSAQVPSYETIKQFFNTLVQMRHEEDKLVDKLPKLGKYRSLVEFTFLKSNPKSFRSFDSSNLLNDFKDFVNKCIEHNGLIGY